MAKKKTEQQERLEKGAQARGAAIRALQDAHRDEYDRLHAKFRVELGLPPRPGGGPSKSDLEERERKLREQLERVRKELTLAG